MQCIVEINIKVTLKLRRAAAARVEKFRNFIAQYAVLFHLQGSRAALLRAAQERVQSRPTGL